MNSRPMLADGVADQVAHLHGATLDDVLNGRVEQPPPNPAPVVGVEAADVAVGDDPIVRVRRYAPIEPASERRPAIVWAHGGAWVGGDLDMPEADAVCRRWSAWLDAIVFSVDYRLAPAHTYPAAMDDVVAAFDAACADPSIDAERVALGGASAGGNLAAAASQMLRDRGTAQPVATVLAYPATDPLVGPYPTDRPDVCPALLWFDHPTTAGAFSLYLGGADPAPYAVPANGVLSGLPPTLVTTSAIDSLAVQAERYAERLVGAGVDTTHHRVDGVLHGYLNLVGTVPAADEALARHAAWLAPHLGLERSR